MPARSGGLWLSANDNEERHTMSRLHREDENLHYCDNSHRWIAPPGIDQSVWEAGVRAHLDEHRATMGGAVRSGDRPRRLPPVAPDLSRRPRRIRRPAVHPVMSSAKR
jgi:hypothetical protein